MCKQAGFRTGDVIIGIEVCILGAESRSPSFLPDDVTPTNPEATSNITATVTTIDTAALGSTSLLRREMTAVTAETTDEEWMRAAQSCEQLDPGAPTVLRVYRPSAGAP